MYIYIYIQLSIAREPIQNCTKEPPIWLASQRCHQTNLSLSIAHRIVIALSAFPQLCYKFSTIKTIYVGVRAYIYTFPRKLSRWRYIVHFMSVGQLIVTLQGFPTQIKTCFSFQFIAWCVTDPLSKLSSNFDVFL